MAELFEVPSCDKCRHPAIHHQVYSGRMMCGRHLSESIHKKFTKAIRKQLIIPKNSHLTILVAISGGKDSAVLLERMVVLKVYKHQEGQLKEKKLDLQ